MSAEIIDQSGKVIGSIKIEPISTNPSQGELIVILTDLEAAQKGEAPFQLLEACKYEYFVNEPNLRVREIPRVVTRSRIPNKGHDRGVIETGSFVGTLPLSVESLSGDYAGHAKIEIRSSKIDYSTDFRLMLEDITEYCSDLVHDIRGFSEGLSTPSPGNDLATAQQRYFVVRSIIGSPQFLDAIRRIISMPHSILENLDVERDIRRIGKPSRETVRQLAVSPRRIALGDDHPLKMRLNISSVPAYVRSRSSSETVDTPENQFIKFVLVSFEQFLLALKRALLRFSRREKNGDITATDRALIDEVQVLIERLWTLSGSSFFSDISNLQRIPYSSPALQRKPGYREIFRSWLAFQTAIQLTWVGSVELFIGGRKDAATLYEYWCFLKIIESFRSTFQVNESLSTLLIEPSIDGLSLKLKAGRRLGPLRGETSLFGREISAELTYNATFEANRDWERSGSWTRRLRPDLTIELWPKAIAKQVSERENLLVRIHFDAKYRADSYFVIDDDDGSAEKDVTYKREDLFKMHAYRDAIRRTQGAFILYPGDGKDTMFRAYRELIPGLGAFSLSPNRRHEGTCTLNTFLRDLVMQVSNRSSQQEERAYFDSIVSASSPLSPLYIRWPEFDLDAGRRMPPPNLTHVYVVKIDSVADRAAISEVGRYKVGDAKGNLSIKKLMNCNILLAVCQEDMSLAAFVIRDGKLSLAEAEEGAEGGSHNCIILEVFERDDLRSFFNAASLQKISSLIQESQHAITTVADLFQL